ncbi:amino acid ABC transporter permease [Paeniglutamicibacter psychrophenolicus]|uniref:amino acid ABC transporter permease n=1 Tax=Paeniglutamicibacter psychrophenolicus TaxID=257454 RepID=UPI00277D1D57|nr:amino acid ABC transporter permease [Paeniglutamicibacter psychrophenolicus]MDQ0093051.1 polar amino acid transport system permease protein [Paeniglutamicibacter psychrophenolicus]
MSTALLVSSIFSVQFPFSGASMQVSITDSDSNLVTDESRASAALPIGKRASTARWISYILAIYVVVLALEFFVFNRNWHWDTVFSYMFSQQIMIGLGNTILLTIFSCVLGLIFGIMAVWARLSNLWVLRTAAGLYIWVVRATPLLVILLMIFFLGALVPTLGIGLPFLEPLVETPTNQVITRFTAAVLGLSLYLGGKSAEVLRSGVISIDSGQFEACKALGISQFNAYLRIIGPQIIRVITPSMANELITMFKNTSLVSVIGFAELLTTVELIYSRNFKTIPLLMVAVLWYLVLTSLAMYGQARLEKRFGRGFNRRVGLSPAVEQQATEMVVLDEQTETQTSRGEGR